AVQEPFGLQSVRDDRDVPALPLHAVVVRGWRSSTSRHDGRPWVCSNGDTQHPRMGKEQAQALRRAATPRLGGGESRWHMANQNTPRAGSGRHWLVLLAASLGVAILLGVPFGVVVVLHTWLEWTIWAVPLLLGLLVFTIGATVLTWNATGEP